MRIPSQFNDGNLYRRGGELPPRHDAIRKLIRLGVALALVVVVMQQAGRKEFYEPFFPDRTPAVVAPRDDATATPVVQASSLIAAESAVSGEALDAAREDTDAVVSRLSTPARRFWMARLEGGVPRELDQAASSETTFSVDPLLSETLEAFDSAVRDDWRPVLQRLALANAEELARMQTPTAWEPGDRLRLTAFRRSLERRVLGDVVDGSPWRGDDFDGLYWFLQQARSGSTAIGAWGDVSPAPKVGVLPLLQQPDIYRGRPVRLIGSVARAEEMPAQENVFGVEQYWHLWLRPEEGGDRPILAVVPDVPPAVVAVADQTIVRDGPSVVIHGRYLKRLAYRSAAGPDLAPVVVGRLPGSGTGVPAGAPPEEAPLPRPTAPSGWLLAAAGLAGFLFAVVAMWRSAVHARRVRRLRHTRDRLPGELLRTLPESSRSDREATPGFGKRQGGGKW